ncbi:aspartate aminotransferase family protein [Burkholderia sp. Bp9140]|uniref:aminotransferase family protein n=1 Tax=Burkholderia sp. Bp9140 TaxID=2184572 RepID=UPI000F58F160|nr:aspartate aminotransferase family protein [Burkholderia sp. Bp9140]RQR44367.1 aspartate aminotransferase family protein [Burkholderia sp. Bp9140]
MTLRYQHFISPTNTIPYPKVVRGEGVYIWDNDGRRLLDGSSGAVAVNIGHRHPAVLAAISDQMNRISYAHSLRWDNDPNEQLAERLERLSAWGYDAAFFVSGGSEANEAAIKFARQLAVSRGERSRWKIISRLPSYHGATTALLGITGDPAYAETFRPMFVEHPKVDAPLLYRRDESESIDDVVSRCLTQLESTIEREGPETILGFIVEPVGGVSTGALVAPDEYYSGIRRICDKYGILLIYDEIMSGAGRTGEFLAAAHWPDCRPDIVALAKGVSGAYAPLGAVLVSRGMVADVRKMGGFKHGHTYAANPISCAASNAVLQVVEQEGLIANADLQGRKLRADLESLQKQHPEIGDIRGRGLLMAIEIVQSPDKKNSFPAEMMAAERIGMHCRNHGLLLFSRRTAGGANGEWLMICPPLTISDSERTELVEGLSAGLQDFAKEAAPRRQKGE